MNEIKHLLARALPDQQPVLTINRDTAIAAGRRAARKRRTRVGAAAGTGAVAAIVIGAGVVTRAGPAVTPPAVPPASTVAGTPTPTAPPVSFVPPLVSERPYPPAEVGNGHHFHLYLDTTALPDTWNLESWESSDGAEAVTARSGAGFATLELSTSESKLRDVMGEPTTGVTVNGRPGRTRVDQVPVDVHRGPKQPMLSGAVRWQLADGVWAQVHANVTATQPADVFLRLAEAVRFDRTMGCVTPFRFGWVPPSAKLVRCAVHLEGPSGSRTWNAFVALRIGRSSFTADTLVQTPIGENTTIGGYPAGVSEQAGDARTGLLRVQVDYGTHKSDLAAWDGYDRAAVLRIAEQYRPVGGDDPRRWVDPLP